MFKLTLAAIGLLAISMAEETKDSVRSEALENIKKYMNPSVSPCDNFFQFACGNWEKTNEIPAGESITNGHQILAKNIHEELKSLLEQDAAVIDAEAERKVKDFYKSCLNTEAAKQKSYQPLVKYFTELNGLGPVLNKDWDESKFDWVELESKLQSHGFDALLGVKFIDNGIIKNDLVIGEPLLPLLPTVYTDSSKKSQLNEYSEYIVKILNEKFSVEIGEAQKVASEIIEFETKLAEGVANEYTQPKDKSYINLKVETLNELYPKIQWEKFLGDAFEQPIDKSLHVVELKKSQKPDYIPNLFDVLEKTPKKVVANYQTWSAIRQFLNVATVPNSNQDKFCVTKTKTLFPKEIGYIYSQKHYDEEIKQDLETMIGELKKTLHSGIEKADWLDAKTKELSLKRLDGVKLEIIGYPKDQKYTVDSDLSKLTINPEEYIENYLKVQQYLHKQYNDKLLKKEKVKELVFDPSGIQLKYDVYENVLKISLGFLNRPFYNKNIPRNMKFAQLGAVIVHELSHGLDRIGQNVDVDGKNGYWWDEKSANTFYDKSQCFYKLYEQHVKVEDVSENLADNVGIKFSYLAYKLWADSVKENKDVFELEQFPGLEFTNQQLFFLTHAQTWCHYGKSADGKTNYPVEFRINLPMHNFDEFSKEFKCPEGSVMNPKEKCVLY